MIAAARREGHDGIGFRASFSLFLLFAASVAAIPLPSASDAECNDAVPALLCRLLLEFYELEKTLYEDDYELTSRPLRLPVPLAGLGRVAYVRASG